VVAILLILVLVGWGVARWRGGRTATLDLGLGSHPTAADRAELERVLERKTTKPAEP
jgi:hypothetical protein